MSKMLKYMVVHKDPNTPWEKVQKNWASLANVEKCKWMRTYFNRKKGVRYCEWLAPDENSLKTIFVDLNIPFESILEVEETVPDLWGIKWKGHLAAEAKASTKAF